MGNFRLGNIKFQYCMNMLNIILKNDLLIFFNIIFSKLISDKLLSDSVKDVFLN